MQIIVKEGRVEVPVLQYGENDILYREGLSPEQVGGKWFHIKQENGSPAYSERYERVFHFYEGRAVVIEHGFHFHILKNGAPAYKKGFEFAGHFHEGLAPVKSEKTCFHINPWGVEAYPLRFEAVGDFHEGFSWVFQAGKFCYINRLGIRTSAWYDEIEDFKEGSAEVKIGSRKFRISTKSTEGKILIP